MGTPVRQLVQVVRDGEDLLFYGVEDGGAVGGYNLYETDDVTIATGLRLRDEVSGDPTGHEPVANFADLPGTLPGGAASGAMYYQLLGACLNEVEGPN